MQQLRFPQTKNEIEKKYGFELNIKEPYDPKEFVDILSRVARDYWAGIHHPLAQLFLEGKLTKEQLRIWAIEEYWFYKGPNYWSAAEIANAPELEDQELLFDPLLTEIGSEKEEGHVKLYLKYLNALGVSYEELINTPLLPTTIVAVSEFYNICKYLSLAEAIAAEKIAGEYINRERHALYVEAFRKYYTWIPEEAIQFHKAHVEEDVRHSQIGIYLAQKYASTKEAQNRMWDAAIRFLALYWTLYEGIYQVAVNGVNMPRFPVNPTFPLQYCQSNPIPKPQIKLKTV
ncbi:MAG: iron-containing redox enzyme family protein [Sulfolobaceae archaeon]